MPGMALEIEGAMQQAAQPLRQLISGGRAKVGLVFMRWYRGPNDHVSSMAWNSTGA
jgi:hypothetical protein